MRELLDKIDELSQKEFGADSSIETKDCLLFFKDGIPVGEIRVNMVGNQVYLDIFKYRDKLESEYVPR
jgi:hypothetical protein